MTAPAFRSNWEHLQAELEVVLALARLEYLRLRAQEPQRFEDNFRGLRITDAEVEVALAPAGSGPEGAQDPRQGLARLRSELYRRREAALRAGVELRLQSAARLFGLDDLSRECLIICLAPEIDPRLAKVYAYLQDDVTKRQPRVSLILDLLGLSGPERLQARRLFQPGSPLLRWRLLRLLEPEAPLIGRGLKIEDRVVDYLLGVEGSEPALAASVRLAEGRDRLSGLVLPATLKERIERAGKNLSGLPVVLCGLSGAGKKTVAESLCARAGRPLVICDLARLGEGGEAADKLPLLLREALLREAALYLDGLEVLARPEPGAALAGVLERLAGFAYPVFLGLNLPELPSWLQVACLPVVFPLPTYGETARIWQTELGGRDDLSELANKFRLTGGQVKRALERARGLSLLEGTNGDLSLSALHRACRQAAGVRLGELARHIEPRYGWDDIVVSEDTKAQLSDICNQMKHRHTVYELWGFERCASRGRGLSALFVGPSGTGKTMAAEIMAAELALDLYKIDLSGVVSKYIGETEKNLERIFGEAQHSGAILFFDEADAIFGKRSEVKDAHDRYANMEVSYLLQRIEDYEGIVILASNLRANIDEAFTRRLSFVVDFPFPEEADRLAIWRKVFPAEAPGAADLDLAALAAQLKVAGGNIRNIAITTAFLAAADGGRLGPEHLRQAVRREFQKMGRLPQSGGAGLRVRDEEGRVQG